MSGVRMQLAKVLSHGAFALFMTTMQISVLIMNCLIYFLTLGIPMLNSIGCSFLSHSFRRMMWRAENRSSIQYIKEEV